MLQYKLTPEQMMEVLDEVERFPNGGTQWGCAHNHGWP
jgi:hypothetical protein